MKPPNFGNFAQKGVKKSENSESISHNALISN